MKRTHFFITLGLLILTISISLFISFPVHNNLKKSKQVIEYYLKREQGYKDIIFQSSRVINSSLSIDSVYLTTIFKGNATKYCVLYRYDTDMCRTCTLNDLEELKNFTENVDNNCIFILASCNNSREGIIGLKNDVKSFNFCIVPRKSMQLQLDGNDLSRYFAVINRSGKIISLFMPDSSLTSLTSDYLNSFCIRWLKFDSHLN